MVGDISKENRQRAALAFRTVHYDRPDSIEDAPASSRSSLYDLYTHNINCLQTPPDDKKVPEEIQNQIEDIEIKQDNAEQMVTEAMHPSVDTLNALLGGICIESNATTCAHTINEVQKESQAKHNLGDTTKAPQSATSTETEPFPDYYESCEEILTTVDKAHEEAYNYAISKVVEEVIRFREVDSNITALAARTPPPLTNADTGASPNSTPAGAHRAAAVFAQRNVNQSENNTNSNETPETAANAAFPHSHGEHHNSDMRKVHALEQMRAITQDPNLKLSIRKRFIAMCNMITQMQYTLFRRHSYPVDPEQFLTAEDCTNVREFALEIMNYVLRVAPVVREELQTTLRVRYIVGELAKEENVSGIVRFKRVAQVIFQHLHQPRSLELTILKAFLDFFWQFVYSDFLSMFNRQLTGQSGLNEHRMEIAIIFNMIWDNLSKIMECYDFITYLSMDIRENVIKPVIAQMAPPPRAEHEILMNQRMFVEMGLEIIKNHLQAKHEAGTGWVPNRLHAVLQGQTVSSRGNDMLSTMLQREAERLRASSEN